MNEGSSAAVRFDFKVDDAMSAQEAGLEYVRHRRMPVFTYGVIDGVCTCHKGANCGKNAGKHPIRNNWPKAAENEQEVRDEYARIRAKAVNVGLILGEQPGGEYLAAIDIDDFDRFVALEKDLGPLPQDTATCHSGRGPRLFYRIPEIIPKARLRNRSGIGGAPGVDAKVGGGQVVVAPSVHSTGKIYTWTRYGEVLTLPVSWADALLEEIAPPRFIHDYTPDTFSQDEKAKKKAYAYLQKAVTEEAARLAHMPEGMRNTYLHRKAVRLLALANGSYSIGKWEYVLRQLENAAVHAGLARVEVRRTLASAEKYVVENGIVSGPRPIPIYDGKPADAPDEPTKPVPVEEEGASGPLIALIQDRGQNAAIAENVARVLAKHATWSGGPRRDMLGQVVRWSNPLPAPIEDIGRSNFVLTDEDRTVVQAWGLANFQIRAGLDTVREGIDLAARRNSFDSLIEHVGKLPKHDGKSRLDFWLVSYFGAPNTEVVRRIGRAWLTSALARALYPGCVADGMLILEGKEGTGKNWGIEELFGGEWVGQLGRYKIGEDSEADRLAGMCWVLHDDELRFRKMSKDAIFSWITRKNDTFRLQHKKEILTVPRRAVVVGSKNPPYQYLDDGENRRFWPVRTGKIDVAAIRRDRLQLLAEALFVAQKNRPSDWIIEKDDPIWGELSEERSDRIVNDPMVLDVLQVLPEDVEIITTRWLLNQLGVPPERRKQVDQAVAAALEQLDFTRVRAPRSVPGRPWIYARSGVVLSGKIKIYL